MINRSFIADSTLQGVLDTPFAWLGLHCRGAALCAIDILPCGSVPLHALQGEFADTVAAQLRAYFADPAYRFDLALDFTGATAFQRRVWAALQDIPAGRTMTYGQLAAQLRTGARAVGAACRSNPIPIVVPCHRIIAAHGLGGYMGHSGLDYKRRLLAHEGFIYKE